MKEQWMPVIFNKRYPSEYIVSNMGEVKDITTGNLLDVKKDPGTGKSCVRLKMRIHKGNYDFAGENAKEVLQPIDSLVAQAFLPNPKRLPAIIHRDGDLFNNRSDNLVWVESKAKGTSKYKWLTEGQLYSICSDLEKGELNTLNEVAEKNHVSRDVVRSIYYRQTYAEYTQYMDFDPKFSDFPYMVNSAFNAYVQGIDYKKTPAYMRFSLTEKERYDYIYRWIDKHLEKMIKKEKKAIGL